MKLSFRRQVGVGISLYRDHIEIVQIREIRGIPEIEIHVEIPLAKEVYDNGQVLDQEKFSLEMKRVFKEYGFPRKGITVSLPTSLIFMRMLWMPNVNRKKMYALLQFRIQDEIRIPFAHPIFDFDFYPQKIPWDQQGEEGTEGGVPILFAAAPGELINRLQESFRMADLHLGAVELKGLSLLRALKALERQPEHGTLVIELDSACVEAHFYYQNVLLMSRALDLTPEQYLDYVPMKHVDFREAAVTLSQERDARQKVPVDQEGLRSSGLDAWSLLNRLEYQASLDSFAADLSYQFDRWISFFQYSLHLRNVSIKHIWLTNDIPNAPRLLHQLAERLDMNVEVVRYPAVVQTGEAPARIVSLTAAGAALRGGTYDAD
jgi:Tfp pilus assembly PilM family ATPase